MSITSETRREAYHAVLPKVAPMGLKVLCAVEKLGDATAEEIMKDMGTSNPNNVAPRLTGLRDGGYIEEAGKRLNRGRHNMTVWIVTDKGKAALRGTNTEGGELGNHSGTRIARKGVGVNGGSR